MSRVYLTWLDNMAKAKTWALPIGGNCHRAMYFASHGHTAFNRLRSSMQNGTNLQQLLILGLLERTRETPSVKMCHTCSGRLQCLTRAKGCTRIQPQYKLTKYGWAALNLLEAQLLKETASLISLEMCVGGKKDQVRISMNLMKVKSVKPKCVITVKPSQKWVDYFKTYRW
jgi:hypothetical protein